MFALVRRALIYIALMVAACGDDGNRHTPDAPIDSPAGSAARAAWGEMEASPRDHNLELGVLAVSVFVAAGPVSLRRRRKSA